ncbi:TIGR01212 family radical SAM protein [Aedoeadaptatus nemausensis]
MITTLPYLSYSAYSQKVYGMKVYKIPIHLKGTCPNRDGTKGRGGCIFCGEEGGSFDWVRGSIREQYRNNKEFIAKRYKAEGFIAYFQNFTGTYLPIEDFRRSLEEIALENPLGVSISTRPDCLGEEYLDCTEDLFGAENVTFELGLQSPNNETLDLLNRGHSVEDYIEGARRLKERGFRLSTHMILDLPWDEEGDMIKGAKLLNEVGSDEVKIHNLYVPKGTKLAEWYGYGQFQPIEMEAFINRVILFLEHLDPDMVIGRLLGRAPEENVLFANWGRSWFYIRDEIVRRMEREGKCQGRLFE